MQEAYRKQRSGLSYLYSVYFVFNMPLKILDFKSYYILYLYLYLYLKYNNKFVIWFVQPGNFITYRSIDLQLIYY